LVAHIAPLVLAGHQLFANGNDHKVDRGTVNKSNKVRSRRIVTQSYMRYPDVDTHNVNTSDGRFGKKAKRLDSMKLYCLLAFASA